MTRLILVVILVFGVLAYRSNLRSPSPSSRRRAFSWAWAFWGAAIGSFFGVAGFGAAIAGTSLGALIGFLASSAWMKVDPVHSEGSAGASLQTVQVSPSLTEAAAVEKHNASAYSLATTKSIDETLRYVFDLWCERRAADPLRSLLSFYPRFGMLGWRQIADGVDMLVSEHHGELTSQELDLLIAAHADANQMADMYPA